jgi:type IV pilus assembly protein PilC
MRFRVTIKRAGTKDEVRTMEAESRFAIYHTVTNEGGIVSAIDEIHGFSLPSSWNLKLTSGVKQREIITLSKNLAAMLVAGLSLARGLSILERQSRNRNLKEVVHAISVAVAQGSTFHESLAVHPRVFSKLYTAMIKAGEESGGLSNALTVLASQMEQSDELTRKVKGAMIYPAIVVTAIVIVAILMLMFVVPTLSATFASLGADLPFATKVIVALSSGVTNHVFIVFGVLTLLIIGGISFLRSMLGKSLILKGALLLPVIGELVRETFAARAARTLASLLTSGVPVLQALSITSEVVGAPLFARVLDESAERVKKGDPLSSAFIEHPKLYPIMMSDMIAVGEETGKLSEMLEQVAAFYEGDVSQKTKDLSTIIEPILMLFIGGMVGVFAVAMVAPIYSLSSSI